MNHEEMPIIDNKVSFARLLEKTHETVAGEAEINIE